MVTRQFKFRNGDMVREKVTGFTGTITGTCFYLTGCNQHLVTAKMTAEGKEPVALWYDEGRLELIGSNLTEKDVKAETKGCDIAPNIGTRGA